MGRQSKASKKATYDHSEYDDDEDQDITTRGSSLDDASDRADEVQRVRNLALRETRRINFTRFAVVSLLIVAGIGISMGTYYFLSESEDEKYEANYKNFLSTIEDQSKFYQQKLHEAFRSMSVRVTSTSIYDKMEWPFVTVPQFEVDARAACRHSGVEAVVWMPIVTEEQRQQWVDYSLEQGPVWVTEARETYIAMGREVFASIEAQHGAEAYDEEIYIPDYIFDLDFTLPPPFTKVSPAPGPFTPFWQSSPPGFNTQYVNYNRYSDPAFTPMMDAVHETKEGVMTAGIPLNFLATSSHGGEPHVQFHNQFTTNELDASSAFDSPHSFLVEPIFDKLDGYKNPDAKVVGYVMAIVAWDHYLQNLLPEGISGIYAVLKNTCDQSWTYLLDGKHAMYLGEGDLHEGPNESERIIPLNDYLFPEETPNVEGHCMYSFYTYTSEEYIAQEESKLPLYITLLVACVFAIVIITFVLYDRFVQQRNNIVIQAAARLNTFLGSLFPATVRDRLFAEAESNASSTRKGFSSRDDLKGFVDDVQPDNTNEDGLGYKGKPIADLFTESTVMFADICGFTAWSSTREPSQVFTLLEAIYREFDIMAKKKKVFKVETVGDCYVAVAGVPELCKDHAVVMARYARNCIFRMRSLTKQLEVKLGPDTADLTLRVGLHSGPVTAGVLRGDKARFQLFGDTMNVASRIENSGESDSIHVSKEAAKFLIEAGKDAWVSERRDKVQIKGKGEMLTYWLSLNAKQGNKNHEGSIVHTDSQIDLDDNLDNFDKMDRLIDWNVDCLATVLKHVIARRNAIAQVGNKKTPAINSTSLPKYQTAGGSTMVEGSTVIDEVAEIITLPTFDPVAAKYEDPDSIDINPEVMAQLRDYVRRVADMYRDNSFHNFEHASHVALSVNKLLSRIVRPNDVQYTEDATKHEQSLHDHTYGITSDPLTQFACIFSALIHDADHTGVPNAQLVKEQTSLAVYYNDQSVAEQNSVDLCFYLLMEPTYEELRKTICPTSAEFKRFRQLVVNSVMATDICDKGLKELRNNRWATAFSETPVDENPRDTVNRKATIVIEHLIQASDVSHTMQHWHIYRKWNEYFFMECYKAYKDGRAEKDPSIGWYKGEIGFFDFYIIPLAKKLKDCGVFGVSSDEYLNYAQKNREEWEARGQEVVAEMMAKVNNMYGNQSTELCTDLGVSV